ncbi:MAG: hypothetical protein LN568_04015 [Rickettsia endosymbiont of Pseudomimeciton antennatum]|nr:hypothetical protein [Rickettsia endosymbiont of Pseudomimeciton antennatum]MCC8398764.1 hypothetical protein [Rickettsia endosymbiont of Labidopullus appendiculatus]
MLIGLSIYPDSKYNKDIAILFFARIMLDLVNIANNIIFTNHIVKEYDIIMVI